MKSRSGLYTWICIVSLCLICIFTIMKVVTLESRVQRLSQRLNLTRVLSPGRSKKEVIQWMGNPSKILRNVTIGGKERASVLVYRSKPQSIQGNEDIWIVLSDSDNIINVYYPDFAQDRIIVNVAEE